MKILRPLVATFAALAVAFTLTACSADDPKPETSSGTASTGAPEPKTSFTIGIATLLEHPSLTRIRDGFVDYLAEKKLDVTYVDENAQGEMSNVPIVASQMHDNANLDLIVAITTPIAQAIVNLEHDRPVLYSGVTDPAYAGLMPTIDGVSGTNVTGASDLNPNAFPVGLINTLMPGVKTIGVLYSAAEPNSAVQVAAFKAEAEPLGITIVESAITASSEIPTGVAALADVDAILIPTDNTVVGGIAMVISYGQQHQIPVFSSDAESLEKGAIATRGLSYYDMGRDTAAMAYRILVEGENPGTIPGLVTQATQLMINPDAAASMGLTIEQAILDQASIIKTAS
ncbi:MAG: ABC transporter substrate-binding protein [Propionibacteriaceae bacterium]|jgi:putative ABC transport system substrate-binding protein|nr:ABC transporter substrate-binding protein [Propionibacteriaceae bacterium]